MKSHREKTYFILGFTLIIAGVVCNEWLLAKLFSPDGTLEAITRVKIRIFDIACILMGVILIKRKPKPHPFLISIATVIITLAVLEGACFVLNYYREKSAPKTTGGIVKEMRMEDEILGFKLKPDSRMHVEKRTDNRKIFDATYSVDSFGRRLTTVKDPEKRNKFILFFGGSYVFGWGVNDNETLASYASQFAPDFDSYNYANFDYGPQHMLAVLEKWDIKNQIKEKEGVAVYVFIDDHVNRAIGTMWHHNALAHRFPYYAVDANGKLAAKGNFTSGRPVIAVIYKLLWKTNIVRYFKIKFPPRIGDRHIRVTCKIIEESKNLLTKEFKNSEFYVLFYPGSTRAAKMIPYLKKMGIKYLDYSALWGENRDVWRIKDDGHPSAKANKMIALKLTEDIGIYHD